MSGPCTARGRARHWLRDYVAVVAAAVALTAVGACGGDDAAESTDAPLGWNGSIEAREVRFWSAASMDSARRWTVVDAPTFAASPDSLDADSGRRGQLYVSQGAFLPDGRVVLLYGGTTQDSVLLHFLDPTSGTESKSRAPAVTTAGR